MGGGGGGGGLDPLSPPLDSPMYLTILLPFTTIIVCSLICLYTLKAKISNNMDADQTAPMEHSGPKVIKLFSCSTQLSIEFQLHIKTIKKNDK